MKTALALTLAVLLSACATISQRPQYFSLSARAEPCVPLESLKALTIGPVEIPRMLDRPGILVRTDAHRFEVREDRLWAGDLGEDIQRVLAENLSRRLGSDRIALFPHTPGIAEGWRLTVQILELSGNPSGEARLQVSWMLFRDGRREQKIMQRQSWSRAVGAGGFEALATAYSDLLADFATTVAERIRVEAP